MQRSLHGQAAGGQLGTSCRALPAAPRGAQLAPSSVLCSVLLTPGVLLWLQPLINYPTKKVKFSCFPWPKQELSPQGLRSGFEVPLPARHKHLRVISSGGRTAVEGEPPDTGSSHISTCSQQQASYHSIQINYPRGRFYKNFLDTATQSAHV